MDNLLDDSVPMGFGMALAENTQALSAFAKLSYEKQQEILNRARSAESKTQMREIVNSITQLIM